METDSGLCVGTVVHNCFITHGFSTAVVLLKILFLLRYCDLSVMQNFCAKKLLSLKTY